MSEKQHTPEPWKIADHDSSIVICFQGKETPHKTTPYFAGGGALEAERNANARRIVACVNACAGIPTEYLEAIQDFEKAGVQTVSTVMRQRDELLAALEEIEPFIPKTSAKEGGAAAYSANVRAADAVREAIASVKGSQ